MSYTVQHERKKPRAIDEHLGHRIRERRLSLNISQSQLAATLGLSFQQIQKYEKGKNRLTAVRLESIAEALSAPIAFFFAEVPSSESSSDLLTVLSTPEGRRLTRAFARVRSQES
ncbi:helix-turn-helix domain-containing protein [Variibacter gotjawalensis]|uniref:helix-turn-helix domain-containing protein n=1 Tax=Variibacter gotjawalensis TaxID=1333996 RepID=UPI0012FD5E01